MTLRTCPDAQLEPDQRTGEAPKGFRRIRLGHGEDTSCHECGCPLDCLDHALEHSAGDLACGRSCALRLLAYWKEEAQRERRIEAAQLEGGF